MPRVFISYRREDSSGYAGRIYDRLASHFGSESIFMDIDTLEPGVDFVNALHGSVASCDVFLAVIGRNWLTAKDEGGRLRLLNPVDFVSIEIAEALESHRIRVVPVLVGGAGMPRYTDLPKRLSSLARR